MKSTSNQEYSPTPPGTWDLIQSDPVQDFIIQSTSLDVADLSLRFKEFAGIPFAMIAQQILGRQKAARKLPAWYQQRGVIYPRSIHLEQSSSALTAQYKSTIIDRTGPAEAMADLTGGFGVDSYFFSKRVNALHYVEPNEELLTIVRRNFSLLGVNNIIYHQMTADEFLKQDIAVDLYYIDPSRRDGSRKTFRLADCEPNLEQIYDGLMGRCRHLVVKTSPLLDLEQGRRTLKDTVQIDVVAVRNECKELIFFCDGQTSPAYEVRAIDLDRSDMAFQFDSRLEAQAHVTYGAVHRFLYEPNAAILKTGAFRTVAERYHLLKLAPSTHFYTSDALLENFPGRVFEITGQFNGELNVQANVITRNYPLSAEAIRKKYRVRDGGEKYLIGLTDAEGKKLYWAIRKDLANPTSNK